MGYERMTAHASSIHLMWRQCHFSTNIYNILCVYATGQIDGVGRAILFKLVNWRELCVRKQWDLLFEISIYCRQWFSMDLDMFFLWLWFWVDKRECLHFDALFSRAYINANVVRSPWAASVRTSNINIPTIFHISNQRLINNQRFFLMLFCRFRQTAGPIDARTRRHSAFVQMQCGWVEES